MRYEKDRRHWRDFGSLVIKQTLCPSKRVKCRCFFELKNMGHVAGYNLTLYGGTCVSECTYFCVKSYAFAKVNVVHFLSVRCLTWRTQTSAEMLVPPFPDTTTLQPTRMLDSSKNRRNEMFIIFFPSMRTNLLWKEAIQNIYF